MKLGAFSISLSVNDLPTSRDFYEKLGFEAIAGDGDNYQIMRSGETTVGLFQGMFPKNMLTFNPGWDASCEKLENFDDVRDIRSALAERGIEISSDTTGDSDAGPASFVVVDPDGNPILIDQHV